MSDLYKSNHKLSFPAERVISKPVIQGPSNQTVTSGSNVKFECKIILSGLQPHIQWLEALQGQRFLHVTRGQTLRHPTTG